MLADGPVMRSADDRPAPFEKWPPAWLVERRAEAAAVAAARLEEARRRRADALERAARTGPLAPDVPAPFD